MFSAHYTGKNGKMSSCILKGAIRLQTVSFAPDDQNTTALAEFGPYIRRGTLIYIVAFNWEVGIFYIEMF